MADTAAQYLSEEQWGKFDENRNKHENISTSKIVHKDLNYNTEPPSLQEIKKAIKKLKRRKATGPDEIPIELFKEMDDDKLIHIQKNHGNMVE